MKKSLVTLVLRMSSRSLNMQNGKLNLPSIVRIWVFWTSVQPAMVVITIIEKFYWLWKKLWKKSLNQLVLTLLHLHFFLWHEWSTKYGTQFSVYGAYLNTHKEMLNISFCHSHPRPDHLSNVHPIRSGLLRHPKILFQRVWQRRFRAIINTRKTFFSLHIISIHDFTLNVPTGWERASYNNDRGHIYQEGHYFLSKLNTTYFGPFTTVHVLA